MRSLRHQPYEIVGVAGDAKYMDLHTAAPRTVYLSAFQEGRGMFSQFALRTDVAPTSVVGEVRRTVSDVLKTVPVAKVTTLTEQVDASIVLERLIAMLSGFFGGLGTLLAAIGLMKQTSLAVNQGDAVYITTEQAYFPDNPLWLVVRSRGDAAALAPAIRNAIWSVDKDQPIVRVATMDELLARSAAERRFALILFEAFALVALVLAATGIYGVLSGSVTERTREIGVRSALGASHGDIVALVVRQGLTLTGLGLVIGLSGAAAASQALITLLFGVSRLDPITYLGVIALLLGVSGIACWVPAWRAARIDPSITLRAD